MGQLSDGLVASLPLFSVPANYVFPNRRVTITTSTVYAGFKNGDNFNRGSYSVEKMETYKSGKVVGVGVFIHSNGLSSGEAEVGASRSLNDNGGADENSDTLKIAVGETGRKVRPISPMSFSAGEYITIRYVVTGAGSVTASIVLYIAWDD